MEDLARVEIQKVLFRASIEKISKKRALLKMLSITKTPTREDLFLDLGTLETQCDVGAVLQTNKQEEKF